MHSGNPFGDRPARNATGRAPGRAPARLRYALRGTPTEPGPAAVRSPRPRILIPAALILSVLILSGCDRPLKMAMGSNQEASVFTVWSRDDDRVAWVRELLETPVVTAIRPEKTFKVTVVEPGGLRSRENWKVHVLLTNLAEPDPVGDLVSKVLSGDEVREMAARPAAHKVVRDAWAVGQTILVLHCADPRAFRDHVSEHGNAILEALEASITAGLVQSLFLSEEQKAMRRGIHERQGFSVRIPAGYSVAEDVEEHIIRLYRLRDTGQAQFVIVQELPGGEPMDADRALRYRDETVFRVNEGDRVEFSRSEGERGRFLGMNAMVLKGLWQNEEYGMGGAFETFFFAQGGRRFMVDISVYYPDGDKLPFLRELRAIASTFRAEGTAATS